MISNTAKNPNRPFWTCASTTGAKCKFFEWESPGTAQQEEPTTPPAKKRRVEGGPACTKCESPVEHKVVRKENENQGRTFYKCDCGHFEFVTQRLLTQPSPSIPGSVEYLVDELTRRKLQRLFEIPPGTDLTSGRDVTDMDEDVDHLNVVCAWRVQNASRKRRYDNFAETQQVSPVELRKEFAEAAADLLGHSVATPSTELLLLHGTKPEYLHDILFSGLDPGLAQRGLFGCGAYFAEDAAKVAQYMTVDEEWRGRQADEEDELHDLHKKLYSAVKHAGNVYYALVCRVKFDEKPLRTRDGKKRLGRSDGELFADGAARRTLSKGKHSLVCELGGAIQRYREFVVFKPEAINIEYVVALKRERYYCDCGRPASKREVVKAGLNKGRTIAMCAQDQCNFFQMYPRCHCGRSAEVALKKNGEPYYRCGARRRGKDRCDFRQWEFP